MKEKGSGVQVGVIGKTSVGVATSSESVGVGVASGASRVQAAQSNNGIKAQNSAIFNSRTYRTRGNMTLHIRRTFKAGFVRYAHPDHI